MKIWISFFMIFSSVLIFSQDKKSIKNFIISFLEYEKNNLKNNHEEVLILAIDSSNAVSYTHLDVYKRQLHNHI